MTYKAHSFHIPVLGIGYSADTPVKVAPYGIDSVVSLVDDILLEKLRKMYCERNGISYVEITNRQDDHRALRITTYLNLIKHISESRFEALKDTASDSGYKLRDYFRMLPEGKALELVVGDGVGFVFRARLELRHQGGRRRHRSRQGRGQKMVRKEAIHGKY